MFRRNSRDGRLRCPTAGAVLMLIRLAMDAAEEPPQKRPTISGTAQVGETLTVDTSEISGEDGMENAVFAYQWVAGGVDIEEATGPGYTIIADDEGLIIQVRVSFTDDAGNYEALTSDGTEAGEPAPPDSRGAVTVVLPVTVDCTVTGAICTEDRRPLSSRLEVTAPGPGG